VEEERREVQRWKNTPSVPTSTSVLTPTSNGISASRTSTSDERGEASSTDTPSDGGGRADRFVAGGKADRWDALPAYAAFVLGLAGLSAEERSEQHARIGGVGVGARVWVDKRWSYVVRFPNSVRGRRSLCLTEIYAMQRAGEWWRLGKPEQARWQLAALAEAKLITPSIVSLKPLPAGAPDTVVTLWQFIDELVAIRRIRTPDERELPLSAPHLVRWCRRKLTEAQTVRAKRWLESHGYITKVGEIANASPARRPTVLWCVAEGEEPGSRRAHDSSRAINQSDNAHVDADYSLSGRTPMEPS
jgi:hypothetical protein